MGGEDAGESRDGRMEASQRGLGFVPPALEQKHGAAVSVWKGCFRQGARSSVEWQGAPPTLRCFMIVSHEIDCLVLQWAQ